jgi:hypothetical protein
MHLVCSLSDSAIRTKTRYKAVCSPCSSHLHSLGKKIDFTHAWAASAPARVVASYLHVVPLTANDVGAAFVVLFQLPLNPTPL